MAVHINTGDLHEGELDLLSIALDWNTNFNLCLVDRAAIQAAHALKLQSNLISLETLAKRIKQNRNFDNEYSSKRLKKINTEFILDRAPDAIKKGTGS